ncbi:MAG: DUF421 domain-containing protein [Bacillus sp. (in: firmicutes)]
MYIDISLKLIIGLICLLVSLRFSGKKLMSQLTPFDFLQIIVLGAIVGGVIYNPKIEIHKLLYTLLLWQILIFIIEKLTHSRGVRKIIKGEDSILMSNGKLNMDEFQKNDLAMEQFRTMLRMNGIFSLTEVKHAQLETNGMLSIVRVNEPDPSALLISNGEYVDKEFRRIGKTKEWLSSQLEEMGYEDRKNLFCVEWTNGRGLHVTPAREK